MSNFEQFIREQAVRIDDRFDLFKWPTGLGVGDHLHAVSDHTPVAAAERYPHTASRFAASVVDERMRAAACATSVIDNQSDDPSINARPDALVLFNPVFDNGPEGFGHEIVKERWQEISPLHNIGVDHPPTVVFLGGEDGLVPVATARDYRGRMEAVEARCELFVYPGHPHGFFNYRDGDTPYYYATVREAARFLAALGFAQGQPTLSASPVGVTRL